MHRDLNTDRRFIALSVAIGLVYVTNTTWRIEMKKNACENRRFLPRWPIASAFLSWEWFFLAMNGTLITYDLQDRTWKLSFVLSLTTKRGIVENSRDENEKRREIESVSVFEKKKKNTYDDLSGWVISRSIGSKEIENERDISARTYNE